MSNEVFNQSILVFNPLKTAFARGLMIWMGETLLTNPFTQRTKEGARGLKVKVNRKLSQKRQKMAINLIVENHVSEQILTGEK